MSEEQQATQTPDESSTVSSSTSEEDGAKSTKIVDKYFLGADSEQTETLLKAAHSQDPRIARIIELIRKSRIAGAPVDATDIKNAECLSALIRCAGSDPETFQNHLYGDIFKLLQNEAIERVKQANTFTSVCNAVTLEAENERLRKERAVRSQNIKERKRSKDEVSGGEGAETPAPKKKKTKKEEGVASSDAAASSSASAVQTKTAGNDVDMGMNV